MGVQGLLPILKSITHKMSLFDYHGLTVAVDAMTWLHKGILSTDVQSLAKQQWSDKEHIGSFQEPGCNSIDHTVRKKIDFGRYSEESSFETLCKTGVEKYENAYRKCISYTINRAKTLQSKYGMKVILVLDGAALPIKRKENENRQADRFKAFQDALSAESKGDSRSARRLYARACAVTHEMKYELTSSCHDHGIKFVVAPYEADAQLAYMSRRGLVDLVITEDSDLLAYRCPRVLFKLDCEEDKGWEIQIVRDLQFNENPSFRTWTHEMFVYMCILSGCDYCDGVKGIGIKGAHKLVRLHRSPSKIFLALKRLGVFERGFDDTFMNAYHTFCHQRVYCPGKKVVKMLSPPQDKWEKEDEIGFEWEFLGPKMHPYEATGVAMGKLHPVYKIPWEAIDALSESKKAQICTLAQKSSCEEDVRSTQREGREESMFAFFPVKKKLKAKRNGESYESESFKERLSLQDIDLNCIENNKYEPKERICRQHIPVHFHEYSSHLVGNTFQPLSRRSKFIGRKNMKSKMAAVVQRVKILPCQLGKRNDKTIEPIRSLSPEGKRQNQLTAHEGERNYFMNQPQSFDGKNPLSVFGIQHSHSGDACEPNILRLKSDDHDIFGNHLCNDHIDNRDIFLSSPTSTEMDNCCLCDGDDSKNREHYLSTETNFKECKDRFDSGLPITSSVEDEYIHANSSGKKYFDLPQTFPFDDSNICFSPELIQEPANTSRFPPPDDFTQESETAGALYPHSSYRELDLHDNDAPENYVDRQNENVKDSECRLKEGRSDARWHTKETVHAMFNLDVPQQRSVGNVETEITASSPSSNDVPAYFDSIPYLDEYSNSNHSTMADMTMARISHNISPQEDETVDPHLKSWENISHFAQELPTDCRK